MERELTQPVALAVDGRLNPEAVGWSRQPLHDTSGVGRWGRTKRWEYWAVMSPQHVVALTVAHLDYAALHSVWVLERASQTVHGRNALQPLGRRTVMAPGFGGPTRARGRNLRIDFEDDTQGSWLRAEVPGIRVAIRAELPEGHERMGVVVPWDDRRFQYTVKDVARPTTGTLRLGDAESAMTGWAVLDHGRGRWPWRLRWNWGAGCGEVGGRVVGVQVGGKWTDGTGSTENALVVDGRVHKISEELRWTYDLGDAMRPWRVEGDRAQLVFTPFFERRDRIELGLVASHQCQCFGTWEGWMRDDRGEKVVVDGVEGWAEDVLNRW